MSMNRLQDWMTRNIDTRDLVDAMTLLIIGLLVLSMLLMLIGLVIMAVLAVTG